MGRASLQLEMGELAALSVVGVTPITRFEKGHSTPIRGNLSALRRAFEAAGVEFLGDDGVRIREVQDHEHPA
jgi:hypothetical protein